MSERLRKMRLHHDTRFVKVRTIKTRSHSRDDCFFHGLPTEVFHMILDLLSVVEMSALCTVSKKFIGFIMDYIDTFSWRKKHIFRNFHPSSCTERRRNFKHYRDIGLLFKKCTMLLPTKKRLRYVFAKFSVVPCLMYAQCCVPNCTGFACLGVFLQTLLAGWSQEEIKKVFFFLCEQTSMFSRIESSFRGKHGARELMEIQLRNFCRNVFLNHWSDQKEYQFWLVELLNPWPLVVQAQLLFILFGPLMPDGTVGWREPVDTLLTNNCLWDLARAILHLFSHSGVKGCTTGSVLAIVEELVDIPHRWEDENIARLLILCGRNICYTILVNKLLSGRLAEMSRCLVFIVLVCEKECYHMNWAAKLVHQICKVITPVSLRFKFIEQLELMFSAVTKELFESAILGNNPDNDDTLDSLQILDSIARFHTRFLFMFIEY
ncbi:F-box only protein 47-like [Synchiropus picturatus]